MNEPKDFLLMQELSYHDSLKRKNLAPIGEYSS